MSGRALRLSSFAKINLGLEVLGVRRDGYHELRTIFQTIDLRDDIERTLIDCIKLGKETGMPEALDRLELALQAQACTDAHLILLQLAVSCIRTINGVMGENNGSFDFRDDYRKLDELEVLSDWRAWFMELLVRQVDDLIMSAIAALEGASEERMVARLVALRENLVEGGGAAGRSEQVGGIVAEAIAAVNAYFEQRLAAVPSIRAYVDELVETERAAHQDSGR